VPFALFRAFVLTLVSVPKRNAHAAGVKRWEQYNLSMFKKKRLTEMVSCAG